LKAIKEIIENFAFVIIVAGGLIVVHGFDRLDVEDILLLAAFGGVAEMCGGLPEVGIRRGNRRGLSVNLDGKGHGPHLQPVAGFEDGLGDLLAVDEGAIPRAEIADTQNALILIDFAMLSRDDREGNAQITQLLAADNRHRLGKGKCLGGTILFEKDQVYVHAIVPFNTNIFVRTSIVQKGRLYKAATTENIGVRRLWCGEPLSWERA
jgi:hypothetical protein